MPLMPVLKHAAPAMYPHPGARAMAYVWAWQGLMHADETETIVLTGEKGITTSPGTLPLDPGTQEKY
jgi:hypothetical protein